MGLTDFERARVTKVLGEYCDAKVPAHARHQVEVRFRFEPNSVMLYEWRRAWDRPEEWNELPIAKFRHHVKRQAWLLFWPDRNLRWHRFDDIEPAGRIEDLLEVVEADVSGIFWG